MERIAWVYILAGGKSSRFGENKATVSVKGQPLIVRLANQVARQNLGVRLVAQRTSDYEAFGIPVIEDMAPNAGPFAGTLAALRDAYQLGMPWCLISGCDMLDWQPEWLPALLRAAELRLELDAILLKGKQEDQEAFRPFPGLYRSSLWSEAQKAWEGGSRSMRGFHQRIQSRIGSGVVEPNLLPKCFNTTSELEMLLGDVSR